MKAIFSLFRMALVTTCNKTKSIHASPLDSSSAATASNLAQILPVIPEGGSLQQTPQILLVPAVAPASPVIAASISDSDSACSSAAASGHYYQTKDFLMLSSADFT